VSSHDDVDLDRARALVMAAIDGEISAAERQELEGLAVRSPALQAEWARMARVKEVTMGMSLQQLPEEAWDRYWGSVYARLERGTAWILLSVGAVVLAAYGAWHAVGALLADTATPVFVRGAIAAMIVGGAILAVSVVRERIVMARRDRYSKEITR
jgi:ferric-dicitrate binding protein FerR (iron transport regulator)